MVLEAFESKEPITGHPKNSTKQIKNGLNKELVTPTAKRKGTASAEERNSRKCMR